MDRKQLIIAISGLASAAIAAAAVTYVMRTGSVEDDIVKVSNELNAKLPTMVDSETRLDATSPGPDRRLTYHLTLLNMTAHNTDTVALRAYLEPRIASNYRSAPEMQELWKNDIELVYDYQDQRGWHVLSIAVKPDQ
jgi:ribosome maturation factor RimP